MKLSRRDLFATTAATALLSSAHVSAAAASPNRSSRSVSGGKPPNIVMVILDDIGFGDLGCFGSNLDTPNIDALAGNGVRFNNFHVTALCAPTRACLLTGQNAHKVGVGNIAEWGRPLPGYRGYLSKDALNLPTMLKREGYNTLAVGKWHLSMVNDQDAMGPYDYWPTGQGFDHWYGFHGSAVDHFHPELFRDRAQIWPDKPDDYHLTTDLIDQSIAYLEESRTATPDAPVYLYLGLGACHFPFHAPDEELARQRGKFDEGWDALRPERFARQKDIGIIPDHASLSPRPDMVPAWNSLSKNEQRFSAKTQEAFAAMLEHADAQIGRLVDALREMDMLDDTVLMVMSDNGAGSGGDPVGRLDVRRVAYIGPETLDEKMAGLDDVGTERANANYPFGWANVGNTPLKMFKADTFEGGIRSPMVMHWPNGTNLKGAILNQYHHAVDIFPTFAELAGATLDRPERRAIAGKSLSYVLQSPDIPTNRTIQHFETAGDRAIWVDGWKAVTRHIKGTEFEDDRWSLYNTEQDFSEMNDLADAHPERLRRMIRLWNREARQNDVLPLDDDLDGLYAQVAPRPRAEYLFYPGRTRLNRLSAPDIHHYNFEISADIRLPSDRANGIILASGDSAAGYEFWLDAGVLTFTYVYTRLAVTRLKASRPLPSGVHQLRLTGQHGPLGTIVTMFDGQTVLARTTIPEMWKIEALNAGVRAGMNRGAPIGFGYEGSNVFEGELDVVKVQLAL